MARVIEFMAEDALQIAEVRAHDKKRITAVDTAGKTHKVPEDKVLFCHEAPSAAAALAQIETLSSAIDLELLRESLLDEGDEQGKEATTLAELFFAQTESLHSSAMFRTLQRDTLYFRRRGKQFSPRSTQELDEVRRMRAAEQRAEDELRQLQVGLREKPISANLAARVERWLRGQTDKLLTSVLNELSAKPQEHAFDLLLQGHHIPATSDLDVLAANLTAEHPAAVVEQAQRVRPERAGAPLSSTFFSIDDSDTREVDDALSVAAEDDLLRVTVDIAGVAALVAPGDPIDREAQRRGATVYLPCQRYYMLPERIGCDLASLHPDTERLVLRTSLWFDESGRVVNCDFSCCWTRVERRLDYETADALLTAGTDDDQTTQALRRLHALALKLRERRRQAGALMIQRPEWKVLVSDEGETISIKQINTKSSSRMLVGELMIGANSAAARHAQTHGVPLIYRSQPAPAQPLPALDPDDPVALLRLRGLIAPACASLTPDPHFGLGLQAYTQVTSPLRRYADLVLQRQLMAHIEARALPYDANGLLEAISAIENTDQQLRRVENAVNLRWMLEYVARQPTRAGLPARVLSEVNGGAKMVLLESGADGLLSLRGKAPPPGTEILVDVERINPRRAMLRVVPSRRASPSA